MANIGGISAVVKMALHLEQPKRFHRDILHDVNWLLREEAPTRFGWFIYDNGSHFIDPLMCVDDEMYAPKFIEGVVRNFDYPANNGKWFWFDGVSLVEMDRETLLGCVEDQIAYMNSYVCEEDDPFAQKAYTDVTQRLEEYA